MPNWSYSKQLVASQIRLMVRESRRSHPYWKFDEVWRHVGGAGEILGFKRLFTVEQQKALALDEYESWPGAND